MVSTYMVTAFTYNGRTDGNQNGMIKAYEVYLSLDGKEWGSPVAKGEFKNTTAMQVATLKTPTLGRYLKLVALSEINGNKWTSAAEIGIRAASNNTQVETITSRPVQTATGIYDLQGRKLADDASLHSTLPKGIYIRNGKKVVSN